MEHHLLELNLEFQARYWITAKIEVLAVLSSQAQRALLKKRQMPRLIYCDGSIGRHTQDHGFRTIDTFCWHGLTKDVGFCSGRWKVDKKGMIPRRIQTGIENINALIFFYH